VRATGSVTFYQGVSIANGLNISSGAMTVAGATVATQSWVSGSYAPQGLATSSGLTVSGARILGRSVGGSAGAVEEIVVSGPLTLASSTLGLDANYVTGILGASAVSILPQTDNLVTLGSDSKRWSTVRGVIGKFGSTYNITLDDNGIIPSHHSLNLGSASARWGDVWVTALRVSNYSGGSQYYANINGIYPTTSGTVAIGDTSARWNGVYASNADFSYLTVGQTLTCGESLVLPTAAPAGASNAKIYWNGATNTLWIYNGTAWKSVTLT
jgi:hypothetical protein